MSFELDTKALRYFAAVAAHKSYTTAAAQLRITQPAVSRQVQAIERAFGVRLFRRQGRQLALTEAGEALHAHAREIMARIDATGELVSQAAGEPTGRLNLGAPISTGELLLPAAISRYRRKYPRVFLHVVTGYTGDLAEMLGEGRLDLALIFGTPAHGDLELTPLVNVDLGLVAPVPPRGRKDPLAGKRTITLAEAARLPLIFPSRAQTLRTVVEQACASVGVSPNIVLESDSLGISKALIKAGEGYMFLAPSALGREIASGELRYIPVARPAITWPLSVAMRRSKSTSLAATRMVQEIAASIGDPEKFPGWKKVRLWRELAR